MKIAVLLTYFNRPILVRGALESVRQSNYKNWKLLVGDDNSKIPAEPIAREVMADCLSQVDFIRSNTTLEEKLSQGTSIGKYANEYLLNSDADIVVTLCDDDKLYPDYLHKLADFYEKNQSIMYAYSDISIYNPFNDVQATLNHKYNQDIGADTPAGRLDASQVTFKADCVRIHGIRFPETTRIGDMPYLNNVDMSFYQQLYDMFGPITRTGFLGQYKGVHDYQLVWHKKQGSLGLHRYIKTVQELGGKVF